MKNVVILAMVLSMTVACNTNDQDALNVTGLVESVNPEDLPIGSQGFINSNFGGEVVTEAYRVTTADEVTYEAFMSNSTNLVFQENSSLYGFGDIRSRVNLESDQIRDTFGGGDHGGTGGMGGSGGMGGNGGMDGTGMGDGDHQGSGEGMFAGEMGFRGHADVEAIEVQPADLPATILDYVAQNFNGNEILMAFLVDWGSRIEYHVLVADVGALIFDENGNFVDRMMRGNRMFDSMEEIALDDLPAAILDYITANYPDNEIANARRVTLPDNSTQYLVGVMEVGVLVFDTDGNFVEVITHGMDGGHGHGG